jgi:hypothetical protein
MSTGQFIAEIERFLGLLRNPAPPGRDSLENMAEALDRLSLAYRHTSERVAISAEPAEPPPSDHEPMHKLAAQAFPGLGFYACVSPEPDASEITMGDAIGDIAEIACDLQEVVWRWENIGPDDAIWEFRFGFQTHWGRHLQDLRRYLHAQLYEK